MNQASPLWTPSPDIIDQALITKFISAVNQRFDRRFSEYDDLYQWSIDEKESFWSMLWDFCGVIGHRGERILINGNDIEKSRWFPDATLNFAENLLRGRWGTCFLFPSTNQSTLSLLTL